MKKIALLLSFVLLLSTVGCGLQMKSDVLMKDKTPEKITNLNKFDKENVVITDFGVRLFQESVDTKRNTLISPLSVIYALAMTANGAESETLREMEEVLGMPVTELNEYLCAYQKALPQDKKYQMNIANSIWFLDDESFTVNEDFLKINADYYGAGIYKTPFDKDTVDDINNWVKKHTNEMIPNILDEIPEFAVMYLINALAFEAEWENTYFDYQVREGDFTLEDGSKQNVYFMSGEEEMYLEDENTTGFLKYYVDRKYAFAALLPEEGMSMEEYVASLDGEKVNLLLENAKEGDVFTSMPKFETEYVVSMKEILEEMGMVKAFDEEDAEFAQLGTSEFGNIYISRVLHKTFISVAEKGTKAGAATMVEAAAEGAMEIEDPKYVDLDRPFVYMLIDCETNIPFFIGTTMQVDYK